MPKNAPHVGGPQRQLTLLDSTCIIAGIIIGVTIFESSPLIAACAGSPLWLLGIWALGGLFAMTGAVCYAELTTTYPKVGGDYVFLTKAYGRRTGFLFAWAEYWIIRPGNIGAMAFVFATYARQLVLLAFGNEATLGTAGHDFAAYACGAIVLLTVVNAVGVKSGKWTQNLLTAVKLLGLLAVFIVAMLIVRGTGASKFSAEPPSLGGFYLAIILVMFAYGGWSDVSYVAAEVRDPSKNLLRTLVLGTAGVMAIYLLINAAFVLALGYEGFVESKAVAADVMGLCLGETGRRAISVLVCISALGAINGMIFTASRVHYAMGREHRLFSWLGRWNARLGTPVRSLALQAAVSIALILGFGMNFERLIVFTAPFFWGFFLLVGLSVFVLRYKDPLAPRTYRVFLYPLTPILFCLSSAFMVYASVTYAISQYDGHREVFWSIGIGLVGIVMCLFDAPTNEADREQETADP